MKQSRVRTGAFDVRCWTGGSGSPLLYLHGFECHPGAAPFLAKLAERHAVAAPEQPGYGSSTGLEHVRDIHDLTLYYRAFVEGLGHGPVDIIGHSLGGMLAAELAILAPQYVRRLVLVSPYGLWEDSQPLPDPFVMRPNVLAQAKWADPARAQSEPMAFDAAEHGSPGEYRTTNLGAASKLMWPIPDKGLSRRLPYLKAPTLLLGGAQDGLVPPAYDAVWRRALPHAEARRIAGAGHLPMIETESVFLDAVETFLAA
ncbi:MAG: alpha/beta hydrolase [Rhizomicrobium sp.]